MAKFTIGADLSQKMRPPIVCLLRAKRLKPVGQRLTAVGNGSRTMVGHNPPQRRSVKRCFHAQAQNNAFESFGGDQA